ncbi:hypothetical protein FRC07_004875 [Ceratobasidium sp. 392]|nr:hypothetical protein FRC07_004875 [Ceratobasidium sp. 392]
MSTTTAHKPSHSRGHSTHAPAFKKRAQHVSNVEKWDVVMWNDEVHSSQLPGQQDDHQSLLSLRSASSENIPRSFVPTESSSFPTGSQRPLASLPNNTPSFAFNASAFGFGSSSTKPRPIPRSMPSSSPVVESPQIRLEALASLHRSVEEHDASFLARMRELEERCHLLPDSLSVLHSDDLSHTTRGRKRGSASWDEDGDVEMSSWNERRRKHFAARSCPRLNLSPSRLSYVEDGHDQKESASGSEDGYVLPDQEGDDSHSDSEDEDDELDIVIVEGSSAPSLLNSGSTPPSLSASLSSLPARSDGRSPNLRNYSLPHVLGTKDVDELSMAMAGGAGSVVDWCTTAAGDNAHDTGSATAEAGALWA